jgi:hypothetical protein
MNARRFVIAGLTALAITSAAHAAERTASVPLKKLFPYLEAYLSLPPAERSRFVMAYRLLSAGKPDPSLKVVVVAGGQRTPLSLDDFGRIARLPTVAQLKMADAKAEVTGPQDRKFNLSLDIEPAMAPAAEMDAHALALASQQATIGAKKAAGVLGFAAPKLDRVVFEGAAGGQALNAQGKATALAVVKGNPVFDPARLPDARLIRFAHPPRRLRLDKAG